MGSIQRSGAATPHITLQQTAQTQGVGLGAALPAAAPAATSPVDAVGALSGQGQASSVQSLANPNHERLKALLDRGDFDALQAQLEQLSPQELQDLPFELSDIKNMAEGFGFSSKMNMVPLLRPYDAEKKALVEKVIAHADLNNNQKLYALKTYSGPPAVLDFVQRSSASQLTGLSESNQFMLMSVLDSESSIWDSMTGGAASEISRRLGGDDAADQVAVKVLRSAGSEQQMLQLLDKVQHFSRDDVAYLYINSLNATELSNMSDQTKEALLEKLVDTSISMGGFSLDLNNLKNVDEFFGMVSSQHVQAAQRLIASMSETAQRSESVQATVQKSDQLLARLGELNTQIQADVASGAITPSKLAQYRAAVAEIAQQAPEGSEIAKRITALSEKLNDLEKGLNQASQTQSQAFQNLSALKDQLAGAKTQASQLAQGIKSLETKLGQQSNQIQTLGQQITAHYTQVVDLYEQSGVQAEGVKQLMGELKSTLENGQNIEQKLPQLQALEKQIQQLVQQTQGRVGTQDRLSERLDALNATVEGQMTQFNALVSDFEGNQAALADQQQALQQLVQDYQGKVENLEALYTTAQNEYNGLATHLDTAQQQPLQAQLQTAATELAEHKAALARLTTEQAQVQTATQTFSQRVAPLKTQVAAVEQTLDTQQGQLKSQSLMLQSATAQLEEILPFNEALLDEVQGVVEKYRSQLNSMSGQDFAQALGELERLQSNLQTAHLSPADFAQQNQKLEALKTQITQMQQQLSLTQSLRGQMGSTLSDLQTQKSQIAQEIQAATEAVDQAKVQQAAAEQSIAQTQQKIEALSGTLDEYEQQLQTWESRLASLDESNAAGKASFMAELASLRAAYESSGQVDVTAAQSSRSTLESGFSQVESERAQIEAQLALLRRDIALTEAEMGAQKSNLAGYEDSLNRQLDIIDASAARATTQREALSALNRESRQLAQQIQQTLGESPSDALMQNSHIAEAMQTLQSLQTQLASDIESSEALIQQSAQTEASTLVQAREIKAARNAVTAQLQSLAQFEQANLAPAQQAAQAVSARFDGLKAREAEVGQQLQQLLAAAEAGDLSLEEFAAQGKVLLENTNTASGLKQVLDVYERVMVRQASIGQQLQTLETAQHQRSAIIQGFDAFLGRHDDVMAQLELQLQQDTAAVDASSQQVLGLKKTLLDERKKLGIHEQGYQQALQEYEQLLNRGESLTSEDQSRLVTLEGQLSATENRLVSSSQGLMTQIQGLNQLKDRVNQATQTLVQQLTQLQATATELKTLQGEVFQDTETALEIKGVLEQSIADVKQALQMLEGSSTLNFTENQAMIQKLKGQLASLEGQLDRVNQYLEVNATQTTKIEALMVDVDVRIQAVEHLKTQFSMLFGRIVEVLEDAQDLVQDLNDLLKALQTLKGDLQDTIAQVEAAVSASNSTRSQALPRQTDAPVSLTETGSGDRPSAPTGQGLANQLSQQFTNLIGRRQREQSQAHQEAFHAHQDKLRQAVDQKLQDRIQAGEASRQQNLQREQQERIVNHLLEEALQGNTQVNTTFNVLNAERP